MSLLVNRAMSLTAKGDVVLRLHALDADAIKLAPVLKYADRREKGQK